MNVKTPTKCAVAARASFWHSFKLLLLSVIFSPVVVAAQEVSTKVALDKISSDIDVLWVLLCAMLVFFMQFGFLAFEIGCIREKNTTVMAIKNIGDWLVTTIIFFLFGFGVMFGVSDSGWWGESLFLGNGIDTSKAQAFFIFQLAFAGTSATIVSGAMAERTSFKAYLAFMLCMGCLIYPVFGFWVWGDSIFASNEPWLKNLGFRDFAGAGVVHSVGAWASLVGIWMVGPRIGRYRSDGSLGNLESTNSPYWMCFGTFVLWLGWWGFNGGSALEWNDRVPSFILKTNLCGAMSGLFAFMHCALMQRNEDLYQKTIGGVLGGLVAATACCDVVSPLASASIGAVAGIIHNMSYDFILKKLRLDDVVGAIPVHGFCGTWGLLCVGLFGNPQLIPCESRIAQLGVQVLGIVVCFAWTVGTSFLVFLFIRSSVGLRVPAMHEIRGLKMSEIDEDEESEKFSHGFQKDVS